MRFITLAIALIALIGVAYVSFSTPSRADVFSSDRPAAAQIAQR